MSGGRILGFVALAIGVVLLIYGIISTQSLGQETLNATTGNYTSHTMWKIIGGIILIILGGIFAFRRK